MCTCYCMLSWPTWQASRCLPLLQWLQKRNQVKILEVRFKHRRARLDASLLIFWPVSYFFHAPWGLLVLSKGTDLCLQTLQPAESILLVLWSSKHLDRQMLLLLHPAKLRQHLKKLAWKPFGMESKMVRLEGFGGLHLFAWYKLAPCCWSFWKTHMIQPEIWSMATFRSIGPSKCVLEKPLEFLPVSTICGVPLRASHQGMWWHLMAPFHPQNF